jgi:hypothetical protein
MIQVIFFLSVFFAAHTQRVFRTADLMLDGHVDFPIVIIGTALPPFAQALLSCFRGMCLPLIVNVLAALAPRSFTRPSLPSPQALFSSLRFLIHFP